MTRSRSGLAYAAIDLCVCLILVILVQINPPSKRSPSIETLGLYAVVTTWEGESDVDTYAMDPSGHVAYFAAQNAGQMHLEHDVIPDVTEIGIKGQREERLILRGTEAGEYVANVQMYRKVGAGPTRVRVRLYRLRGDDTLVQDRTVTLPSDGSERTAFRFTMNGKGDVTGFSDLQRSLVGSATPQGPPAPEFTGPPVHGGGQ